MAARKENSNNKRSQSSWIPLILKSGAAAVIISGGYYYYKNYLHALSSPSPQHTEDDSPFPIYNPTPLGDDFDDTDDPSNTTFYTSTNGTGDGIKVSAREEYIGTLLQQRRTLSVLKNPYLNHHKIEHYFHLGFNSSSPILSHFSRIKWVIIVRSKSDVQLVGQRILNEFPHFKEEKNHNKLPKPIGSTDRFYMLQISSIIIVSCGIGAASISILLQELTKVLVDAGAFTPSENNTSLTYQTSYVEYILLISAPGIKTSPSAKVYKRRNSLNNILDQNALNSHRSGTLRRDNAANNSFKNLKGMRVDLRAQREKNSAIFGNNNDHSEHKAQDTIETRPSQITSGEVPVYIPTSCYNEKLTIQRDIVSCGENIIRPMKFDRNLISDIKIRCGFLRSLKPKLGKGLSVKYFNEALSHNSVAINQENNVKSKFIQSCIDQDIKYVDMESGYFAAFCNTLNISCVAIVGIEYDIAAPSRSDNNMRVTHDTALQATMDIFCQYLWDRISKDLKNKKGKIVVMKRGISVDNNDNDDDDNNDNNEDLGVDDNGPIKLKNSRSVPVGKREYVVDDAAPKAFDDIEMNVKFNENELNDYNEGVK